MHSEETEFGFLCHPKSGGPHPGVVMIPDVWGLAEHTRALALKLARERFAVLAADPYRLTGRGEFDDPTSAMKFIATLSDPLLLKTLQQCIHFLKEQPSVRARRVGVTGFCMGGQYALLAACGCTGLSACAPFYGMVRYEEGLDPALKPRSPLDALANLTCPVLGFYGGEDAIIPLADVRALEAALKAAPHPGAVQRYAGAGHAFMNDTRPALYRAAAARDAFARLVRFLRDELG